MSGFKKEFERVSSLDEKIREASKVPRDRNTVMKALAIIKNYCQKTDCRCEECVIAEKIGCSRELAVLVPLYWDLYKENNNDKIRQRER